MEPKIVGDLNVLSIFIRRIEASRALRPIVSEPQDQFEKDLAMSADELIEDFTLGVLRVCDENLEMNKRRDPNYPEGDEIAYDVMHQSCHELSHILSYKEDAIEAIGRWLDHERWCVRALSKGAKHLLEHGSFNFGPITGVEYDEGMEDEYDLDSFIDFADGVT